MRVWKLTLMALAIPLAAQADNFTCSIDPKTEAHKCFRKIDVREVDGIRSAPMYAGGPKGSLEKTPYTVNANCKTRVLHLKDAKGVSFAGGNFSATAVSRQLGGSLCEAELPVAKKKT